MNTVGNYYKPPFPFTPPPPLVETGYQCIHSMQQMINILYDLKSLRIWFFCHFISTVINERDVIFEFFQSSKWKLTTPQANFTAKSKDFCTQPKCLCLKIYLSLFYPKIVFMTNWKTIHYFKEVHKYTRNKVTTKFVSCTSYCQEINSKKQWSFIN